MAPFYTWMITGQMGTGEQTSQNTALKTQQNLMCEMDFWFSLWFMNLQYDEPFNATTAYNKYNYCSYLILGLE